MNPETDKIALLQRGRSVMTPGGIPIEVELRDHDLLHPAVSDLKVGRGKHPEKLSILSMLFTQVEYLDRGVDAVGKNFENALLNDVALRTCAGPEEGFQLKRLKFLIEYLKEEGLSHPRLPQTLDGAAVKDELMRGRNAGSWSRFVLTLSARYGRLTKRKKCVVVNAHFVHNSTSLGLMLALGRCDAQEYARALNAANCIGAGVWSGISTADERRALSGALLDARILKAYLK